jgi:nitrate reductase NapE component
MHPAAKPAKNVSAYAMFLFIAVLLFPQLLFVIAPVFLFVVIGNSKNDYYKQAKNH